MPHSEIIKVAVVATASASVPNTKLSLQVKYQKFHHYHKQQSLDHQHRNNVKIIDLVLRFFFSYISIIDAEIFI